MPRKLEIIGGGYDYLSNVTSLGMLSIEKATLILYPELLGHETIRRINKTAQLVPYSESENPLSRVLSFQDPGTHSAIILEDGIASASLLENLASIDPGDFSVRYFPTIPLWQAACYKAGIRFPEMVRKFFPDIILGGEIRAKTGSRGAPGDQDPFLLYVSASSLDGNWPEMNETMFPSGTVDIIGFDGKVLWPRRRLPLEEIAPFASYLQPNGKVIIISTGAGINRIPLSGLAGRGILVTRSIDQADELGKLLLMTGATPFYFPTIELADPESWMEVDEAVDKLGDFNGIILTSVNAVTLFMGRLRERGLDIRTLSGCKVLAVGEKTAEALLKAGIRPDAVPQDYRAEGLVDLLKQTGVRGQRFLLPRAEVAREILPEKIRDMGGSIEVVTLYRTLRGSPDTGQLAILHQAGLIDAVVFTSGSTFRYFVEIVGSRKSADILQNTAVVCIGPVTASVVEKAGFHVSAVPELYTMEGVISALEGHFNRVS